MTRKTPLTESEETIEENALETHTADLSETLKSETTDSQFTQTFSPESKSKSTSTATATTVKSVGSKKTYETESQPRKSNKMLLIGGGFAVAIGVILLLILL